LHKNQAQKNFKSTCVCVCARAHKFPIKKLSSWLKLQLVSLDFPIHYPRMQVIAQISGTFHPCTLRVFPLLQFPRQSPPQETVAELCPADEVVHLAPWNTSTRLLALQSVLTSEAGWNPSFHQNYQGKLNWTLTTA